MRILAGLAAFLLGGALVAAGVELLGPTPWVLAGFGVLLFMASAAWLARAKAASVERERKLRREVDDATRSREGPYRGHEPRQALRRGPKDG